MVIGLPLKVLSDFPVEDLLVEDPALFRGIACRRNTPALGFVRRTPSESPLIIRETTFPNLICGAGPDMLLIGKEVFLSVIYPFSSSSSTFNVGSVCRFLPIAVSFGPYVTRFTNITLDRFLGGTSEAEGRISRCFLPSP